MAVAFDTPDGRVNGTVIRVNKKTVSVEPDGGNGNHYRVSPSALHVRDAMADTLHAVGHAVLRITQDDIAACVKVAVDGESNATLERVHAVMDNPGGRLVIVADHRDVMNGLHHGWGSFIAYMAGSESAVKMAGRLGLAISGFDGDPRALFQIPESARWLQQLQAMFPWLGALIDPATAFQLIGSLAPFKVVNGQPIAGQEHRQAAIHIANYAIALTLREGGRELTHVDDLLTLVGLTKLPPGFFSEAPALASQLDNFGRRYA